ncbi:hypothetical protein N9U05_00365 [bacterium]|nr:hypothetical protein [bacterium]
MKIAEEPAENPSDELTQIEYDKKTALLSGKPLAEAMPEIKERGASHQNIADEIDEMTKGNKPRFGGFPCPSVSVVQKICSDVNKLQQAGVASRLAKFEFTISSWVSHRVRSLSPDSDRGAGSGSCSDGASGHDSSSFSSSDEHDLEEEEAPEDAEALDYYYYENGIIITESTFTRGAYASDGRSVPCPAQGNAAKPDYAHVLGPKRGAHKLVHEAVRVRFRRRDRRS